MNFKAYLTGMLLSAGLMLSAHAQITESEPNNDSTTANTITHGAPPWADSGNLMMDPPGDNDWFAVSLNAGEVITVQTTPTGGTGNPDTVVGIVDPTGTTVLASDDDSGPGLGSLVSYAATTTGTYYIAIAGYHGGGQGVVSYYTGAHTVSGPYTLDVVIDPVPVIWDETADGLGDAGDMPSNAQIVHRSDTTPCETQVDRVRGTHDVDDVDMYVICITDPATFVASTVGSASWDTQLWLFNCDGTGVVFNDDSTGLQSRIDNSTGCITEPGTYLLTVSRYNRDAVDADGNLIWNNTPFAGVRCPDGPGAANPIAGWTGATSGGGSYSIQLRGSYFVSEGGCVEEPECDGDVNGDGCVDDRDLLIVLFNFGQFGAGIPGDLNNDFVVDDVDLLIVLFDFGCGCGD